MSLLEVNYKEKYLKYKSKYIQLNNIIGGEGKNVINLNLQEYFLQKNIIYANNQKNEMNLD